jgi:FaeA-like protein
MSGVSTAFPGEPTLFQSVRAGATGGRGVVDVAALTDVFQRHLYLPDPLALHALLGAVAANLLPGDPIWLGIVAPPSSAKTEMLNALGLLVPRVIQVAVVTPAALLSGTSRREKAAHATGGLLRQIGECGIIACKDFGSVLSMRPEARAETLAALREIYDGAWTRHVGTDGGQALEWSGKLGLVFGCTPALDTHHGFMSAMGERFLLVRIPPAGHEQAERALCHSGANTASMRRELAETVAALFQSRRSNPEALSSEEREELASLATLTVRLRSTVERNRYSREIEAVPGAEGPARLVKMLRGLLDGLDVLGYPRPLALKVVRRVAHDSVPPLRWSAFDWVRKHGAPTEIKNVAVALGLPANTVRRALEDLAAYNLVTRTPLGDGKSDLWSAGAAP